MKRLVRVILMLITVCVLLSKTVFAAKTDITYHLDELGMPRNLFCNKCGTKILKE